MLPVRKRTLGFVLLATPLLALVGFDIFFMFEILGAIKTLIGFAILAAVVAWIFISLRLIFGND
jgi:hypothetical protein